MGCNRNTRAGTISQNPTCETLESSDSETRYKLKDDKIEYIDGSTLSSPTSLVCTWTSEMRSVVDTSHKINYNIDAVDDRDSKQRCTRSMFLTRSFKKTTE